VGGREESNGDAVEILAIGDIAAAMAVLLIVAARMTPFFRERKWLRINEAVR
jgi:hypothetical protein